MSLRAQHVGILLNKIQGQQKSGQPALLFALVPGGTVGRTQPPQILFQIIIQNYLIFNF